ncbi:glycoside hydrolase family 16 protein [Nonomuraea fuscirosea]|uniref:glycoside hydrolase family 16 protein n=1 Tax=Nonomuraea fuscirosea TaxID=1291556 RepID=UPI00342D2C7A
MRKLEFEDTFQGDRVEETKWIPYYLPQWTTRTAAAARYRLGDGLLRLLIEEEQPPWHPETEGAMRVSSLQTGIFSGPAGSRIGQHGRGAVVQEEYPELRLYTPLYGRIEMRAKAVDDPRCMVALWMIGFEDEPERSAEICVAEIFGRDVGPDEARIGMGLHPFGDPSIADDFTVETMPIDAREFHVYAVDWTPGRVSFFVDGQHVRTINQAPAYPMQLMLNIFEFEPGGVYPKEFTVDYVRGYAQAHPAGGALG